MPENILNDLAEMEIEPGIVSNKELHMRKNYKRIGDYINELKTRNTDLSAKKLLGININKYFMPSVANIVGTNMSVYKIVEKNQFACNRMHVGRDDRLPIAMSLTDEKFMVSPAYDVFEISDLNVLHPEYLMMWFSRKEFDRNAWFYTDADVRGGLSWEAFCNMMLPIPSLSKQKEIVKEYKVIQDRIELNNQLIQKLEETAQAIYKQWFVEFEFPDENGEPYKSSGGEMVESEFGQIPKGWSQKHVQEIGKVVDSLHTTPEYTSQGYPMVRVTDVNSGFLDLTNTMVVDEETFKKFSRNHKSKKGDIIVSRVGATFGEFSYAHTDEKFCLGQNTAVIIPTILDSKLMYTALTTSIIRNQIDSKAVGSAYSTLSLQDIKELTIMLPDKNFKLITDALTGKFEVLFINRSLCCQENWYLIKMSDLLLSKLATIEN